MMPKVGFVYLKPLQGTHLFFFWGPRSPGSYSPSQLPQLASISNSNLVPATLSIPCPSVRISLGLPWVRKALFHLETNEGSGQGLKVSTTTNEGSGRGGLGGVLIAKLCFAHSLTPTPKLG